jgi:hypothetical protein
MSTRWRRADASVPMTQIHVMSAISTTAKAITPHFDSAAASQPNSRNV